MRQPQERSINKTPDRPGEQTKSSAIMLLGEGFLLDRERWADSIRRTHGGACGRVEILSGKDHAPDSGMVMIAGQIVAFLTFTDVPVGWQHLAKLSIHWPDAVKACGRHRGHMIIMLMGTPPDALSGARAVSAVAGALAASHPEIVVAGMWNSTVLNSAETWVTLAADAFKPYPNLPTSLWVSRHPFSDARTGAVGVVTRGLSRFVGRELELLDPGRGLKLVLDQALGLVVYLVQNGPVLRDGSTFGVSETERIAVRFANSDRFGGLAVISATLSTNPLSVRA